MGRESSPALNGPTPPNLTPDDRLPPPRPLPPSSLDWGNSTGSDHTGDGSLVGPYLLSKAANCYRKIRGSALNHDFEAKGTPGLHRPSEKGALRPRPRRRKQIGEERFDQAAPSFCVAS